MAFYVKDEFRTNSLSLREGGYDVEIFFKNGSSRVYKRVKNPGAFFAKAKSEGNGSKSYRVLGPSIS